MIRSASREKIYGKHQRLADARALEFARVARAARDCAQAFSRNQFPDQTQSPWDQCPTLWRVHIVVEKNQPLPKPHRHIECPLASSVDFPACSMVKKFTPTAKESGVTFRPAITSP